MRSRIDGEILWLVYSFNSQISVVPITLISSFVGVSYEPTNQTVYRTAI